MNSPEWIGYENYDEVKGNRTYFFLRTVEALTPPQQILSKGLNMGYDGEKVEHLRCKGCGRAKFQVGRVGSSSFIDCVSCGWEAILHGG